MFIGEPLGVGVTVHVGGGLVEVKPCQLARHLLVMDRTVAHRVRFDLLSTLVTSCLVDLVHVVTGRYSFGFDG